MSAEREPPSRRDHDKSAEREPPSRRDHDKSAEREPPSRRDHDKSARWICLDVGECLIDETRVWETWADVLDVPRFTLGAVIGALIDRGRPHFEAFSLLGRHGWRALQEAFEAAYGGFRAVDLYPDALDALARLPALGYRVSVIANQPAIRAEQLRALGVVPDVMAMSEAMGVEKPDPAFFARALELMDSPDPTDVTYVGDRVDNDVLPALDAGMHAVWLRRGPWGLLGALPPGHPGVRQIHGLDELP